MALIDTTYFFGPLLIPQVTDTNVAARLTMFIDEYERKYLQSILGYELWKLFNANQAEQIYKDIIDGAEFQDYSDHLAKWQGLKFTIGTAKKSPIANYIYFLYTRDNATQTTASGEKIIDAENASVTTAWHKLVRAWNEMVEWNLVLRDFLRKNKDSVYPTWIDNGLRNELYQKINPLF